MERCTLTTSSRISGEGVAAERSTFKNTHTHKYRRPHTLTEQKPRNTQTHNDTALTSPREKAATCSGGHNAGTVELYRRLSTMPDHSWMSVCCCGPCYTFGRTVRPKTSPSSGPIPLQHRFFSDTDSAKKAEANTRESRICNPERVASLRRDRTVED